MFKKQYLFLIGKVLLVLCLMVLIIAGYGCRKKKRAGLGSDGSSGDGNGTIFVLSPPSNLTGIEMSPYQIYLSWTDNSNNEDGFEIARAINDPLYYTPLTTVPAGTTSYFDNTVSPLNTYYYRVQAFNTVPDYSGYSNQVSVFTSIGTWTKISAGENYSLALTNNGTLWCWGDNLYGELGLGIFDPYILTPTQIGSDIDWSSMSAGNYHALAIKTGTRAGTLWAWGADNSGQLGIGASGDDAYSDTPTQVGADSDWSVISAGGIHTLGIKNGSTLWSWGDNIYGQLGLGDSGLGTVRWTPTQIGTGTDWATISAGYYYNLALKTNKTIWAWGFNDYMGRLGLGVYDYDQRNRPNQIGGTPSPHPALTITLTVLGIVDLSWTNTDTEEGFKIWRSVTPTLSAYSLLDTLSSDITFYSDTTVITNTAYNYRVEAFNNFGENLSAPVSLVITDTYVPKSASVNSSSIPAFTSDWSVISAKFSRSLACKTDCTLWTWGQWRYAYNTYPTKIGTDTDWADVVAGGDSTANYFNIVRKTNGTIWSWGTTQDGQLGLGDINERVSPPMQIGSDSDWSVVVAGANHCLGLKNMGSLWSWGAMIYTNRGQLGMGDTIGRNIPSPLASPIAPSDLIITVISLSQMDLSWTDNSDNESGFKIERKDGVTESYAQIATFDRDITSYSDTGLNPGNTYYYRVRAYNTFGNSPYSNASSDFTPVAPSSLSATIILPNRINLSWTDNSPDESGFRIERKINFSGDYEEVSIVGAGVNTWSDYPISISSGTYYFYRVRAYNNFGNSPYSDEFWVASAGDWLTCSAGYLHTIGTKTNGTIWAWGANSYGQLGLGDTNTRTTPTEIASNLGQISPGGFHNISKRTDGSILAWGDNRSGQLGLGNTISRTTPARIGNDTDWSVLTAACYFSAGIKTTGELWTWGNNYCGQLGLNDIISRTTPSKVGTDTDWVAVSMGDMTQLNYPAHTIGKKIDGTIWVWGDNRYGQLGLGDTISRTTPTRLGAETDWSVVRACTNYSIAKKTDNTLWSWGFNYAGQLGLGDSNIGTERKTPTQIGTDSDWATFTTSSNDMMSYSFGPTIAIKTNGTIWIWGLNQYGMLGIGLTDTNRMVMTPMQIGVDSDWSAVTAGYNHVIARKTNATLWTWGRNNLGQLGLGDTENRDVPTLLVQ